MPSTQEIVAESIRSALYSMTFVELLGEGKHDKWPEASSCTFHRLGEKGPKCVLVTVAEIAKGENLGCVQVHCEWLNLSGGSVLRATQTGTINCNNTLAANAAELNPAATDAVEQALLIYRDVLEGTGKAGPIEDLMPPADEDEDATEDDESEAPDENEVWK